MIKLIVIILFIIIKTINCAIYVDLKFNFASEGVFIHYGSFMHNGNYLMYLGEEQPLEKVNFGSQKMFPTRIVWPDYYQLIVEVFDTGCRRFACIHAYLFKKGIQDSITKYYYELGQNTYIELDTEMFLLEVNEPVLLSMDIGPRHRHPFILRTVVETAIEKKVTYSIIGEFNGAKLNGVEAPKYELGAIYDSGRPIVVGFSKLDTFIKRCNEVTIEYRVQPIKVVIKIGRFMMVYDLKTIINNEVWHLVQRPGLSHLELPIKKAILNHDKIVASQHNFLVITLDVAEQLTPELYGIEKTIGTIGIYGYVIYEVSMKYRQSYVIKNIIDMGTDFIQIFTTSKDCEFCTVEVLRSHDRTIVIVTSQIKVGMTCIREVDIFERSNKFHLFYNKIEEHEKAAFLLSIQKMYPVRLNVILDESEKAIYDKKEITGAGMTFLHYAIKDYDQRGNDLRNKYIFGVIWEVAPYQTGNIPYESFRTEYRLVKNAINTRKFMIRNTVMGIPVDVRAYEIYTVLFHQW